MDSLLTIYDSEQARGLNSDLADFLLSLPEEQFSKRSHYFHGRYENLYIDQSVHPGLQAIIELGLTKAAEILNQPKKSLRVGFWLNIMNKGDVTTLHSHDDDDELLSAVYYVLVPESSGLFRLHEQNKVQEIAPVEGRFMFFDPVLPHEVTEHRSREPRVSIGMNIGPADPEGIEN
ncbi:MAG: 2OG-Fe(II) oxygenase family protein [Gammaproteobacteria bacterium]|nr:2OG-Fe(II) oxygenase family protein [Gammaproteobacteria bacterium]